MKSNYTLSYVNSNPDVGLPTVKASLDNDPPASCKVENIIALRSHSTLFIVQDAYKNSTEKYVERVTRLAGSLNCPNTMKADFVTLADGTFYPGITFKAETAELPSSDDIKKLYSANVWVSIITINDGNGVEYANV